MSNQQVYDGSQKASMLKELIRKANLVWRLWLDPRVSVLTKLIPAGVLLYVLSPVDLIPDWIVGLGQLDDLAIILIGIRTFIALCPPELVQWHRDELAHADEPKTNADNTIDGTYHVIDE